jgi:hydroxyethylthiazole kinase-like uncharacterized protein yjeF
MSRAVEVDADFLRSHPLPWPRGGGDKEERGRVIVVAGSRELPGAALLAGTAALRAGAGKLQICTARSVALGLGLAVPEALVLGLDETPDGAITPAEADRVGERAGRCQAVLVGPGLVEGDDTARLTASLLATLDQVPIVLDAAAMMRLANDKDALRRHDGRVVLTPHAGEMAKIMGLDKDEITAAPEETARRAAGELGAIVLLKGARSFMATPAGETFTSDHGHVGLATSGSGDTLAGFIAGLAARGADPLHALLWGVYVHGEAGNRLASKRGPLGFLAREIPDEAPAILADLRPPDA